VPSGRTGATGATGGSPSTGHRRSDTAPPNVTVPTGPLVPSAEVVRLGRVMDAAMRTLGDHSSAYAVDLENGQVLFSDDAEIPRNPASVEKLYTLTTALVLFGPDGTLQTRVYASGTLRGGVLHGNLYLRGGGDPTFGDAHFDRLNYGTGTTVQALARLLIERTRIRKIKGSVIGDETYFDDRRGGPSAGYGVDPNLVGELSALAFDRGATGSLGSPAAYAAFALAGALRHDGVVVTGRSHAGVTDVARSSLLATINSPPMATLARLTAVPSDDFFAEMLLKALGARFGTGGTTAAGAEVVRRFLATLHLEPAIVDGSGLSRDDRTTPVEVVTLLRDLSPGGIPALQPIGEALRAAMPVVSEDGTLEFRMHGSAASGHCVAKTGTLSDASDLAGWCNGEVAFAFLMNHVDVYSAQDAQDTMTIALAKLSARLLRAGLLQRPSSSSSPASSITATPRRSAFSSLEPALSPATR